MFYVKVFQSLPIFGKHWTNALMKVLWRRELSVLPDLIIYDSVIVKSNGGKISTAL